MGATEVGELRDIGRLLADLKEPEPPKGLRDAGRLLHMARTLWTMRPVGGAARSVPRGGRSTATRSTSARSPSRPAGPTTPGR